MTFSLFRIAALTWACSVPVFASAPSTDTVKQHLQLKLEALFQQPVAAQGDVVRTVTLLASAQQIAAVCETPELSVAGQDNRLTGKRTVVARCGTRKIFLPVRVNASGTWWVASQSLPSGAILQQSDIEPHTGNIDGQPAGLIFQPEEIIGQRLTRALTAGKPVLQNQLRQQWRLHAGQQVDLVTTGNGFRIRGQGKALNNAAIDDTLRVQTANGQTVSGKVAPDGQVMIFLRQ